MVPSFGVPQILTDASFDNLDGLANTFLDVIRSMAPQLLNSVALLLNTSLCCTCVAFKSV